MSRHPQLLSKNKSAILLVDYQEKFAPHLTENKTVLSNIVFLLLGAEIYNLPIIVSEHVPEKLGKTVSELHPFLKSSTLITKSTMSCCASTNIVEILKKQKIEQVAICGIEAHICIMQTSLDLIHNGFQVHLLTDAITCRVLSNKPVAIARIESAGGIISSVESALFEVAYEAGTEEFKKLQALYKNPAKA